MVSVRVCPKLLVEEILEGILTMTLILLHFFCFKIFFNVLLDSFKSRFASARYTNAKSQYWILNFRNRTASVSIGEPDLLCYDSSCLDNDHKGFTFAKPQIKNPH